MLDTLSYYFYFPFLIAISTALVFFTMPSILHVCRERKLYDSVGFRKMHDHGIPRLGGLAMFFSFMITLLAFTEAEKVLPLKAIVVSSMFISFVSLKDDLVGVGALKKLLIHVFVSAVLVIWGGIQLTNLHGVFGIYKLDYLSSVIISISFITYIINAFNLIDGIDGLAASIGLLGSLVFGIFFLFAGQKELASVAICMSGALGGFLWYNYHPAKIFMGDTGAYLIGVILSLLAIRFIEINPLAIIHNNTGADTSPAVALAVIIVPVFDTVRVTLIRISRGFSPFTADNNHIHHKLKNAGLSHSQIVITLVFFNLLVISSVYFVYDFGSYFALSFIMIECLLFNIMTTAMLNTKATRFSFRNFLW